MKAVGMTPDDIINEVKASNLRGRGGAGFPTGMKWTFVPRNVDKPKYIVVNADESEPGTCKDRVLMENDPHQLIEGMMIAALAVGAKAGYIYIRGEYRYLIEIMDKAIAEAYAQGWLGKNINGTGFDFDCYTHTRRGRVRVRRRIGAARIARRQARHSPHSSAIPGCVGRMAVADGSQQRRDILRRAVDHSERRQMVRRSRHTEERRHTLVLPLRSREQARRLRTADGLQPPPHDQ